MGTGNFTQVFPLAHGGGVLLFWLTLVKGESRMRTLFENRFKIPTLKAISWQGEEGVGFHLSSPVAYIVLALLKIAQ